MFKRDSESDPGYRRYEAKAAASGVVIQSLFLLHNVLRGLRSKGANIQRDAISFKLR